MHRHHIDPGRHLSNRLSAGRREQHEVTAAQEQKKRGERHRWKDTALAELQPADLQREVQNSGAYRTQNHGVDDRGQQPCPSAGRRVRCVHRIGRRSRRRVRQRRRPEGGHRRPVPSEVDGPVPSGVEGSLEIEDRLVHRGPAADACDHRIRSPDRKRRPWHGGRRHERRIIVDRPLLEERQVERARDRARLRRARTGRLRDAESGQREITERSDRLVACLDRQIGCVHVDRERKLVPAVPAALKAVEADVLTLRTFHGRRMSCGTGGGDEPEPPARSAARSWS